MAAGLAALAVVLYIMSTSAGSLLITGPLETRIARKLPADGARAAVIVLAGGSSYDDKGSSVHPGIYALERVFAAVQLANARKGETIMIFSGGNVFGANDRSEAAALADAAKQMGWHGRSILEEHSRTTAENFKRCAEYMRGSKIDTAVIVTSAFHMPRSAANAKRCMPDVTVFPYPSGRLTDPVIRGVSSFLPNGSDFQTSCLGIKERVGILARR